jgi:CxxC motif-containing protein
MGCNMEVEFGDNGALSIKGNGCKRGAAYAKTECTNPVRTLTTTVRVENGKMPVLPVKSQKPLPKGMLFDCMKCINTAKAKAPVAIGDMIVENILGTGINIVAAGNVSEK